MTCESCTYYFPDTGNAQTKVRSGECRRFPPQVVQTLDVVDTIQEYVHPEVGSDHWCGEYYESEDEWSGQKPN